MNNEKKIRYSLITFLIIYILIAVFTIIRANIVDSNDNSITQNQSIYIDNVSDQLDKININTCSKEALESLPSIGETLADKIISGRPYNDVYELNIIPGIGDTIIQNIKDKVVCE
jgi:DNA uptake protein ComE-like DNA-binding protein